MKTRLLGLRQLIFVFLLLTGQALFAANTSSSSIPVEATPPKFALIIGNANYTGNRRSLKNPVNDAKLMTQTLRKLGFEVSQHTDLDRAQMFKAVADFSAAVPEGAAAVVFYAGHGMQIGGASYLIPVDMTVTSEQSVPLRAYPLKNLLERVSASKSAVNVVVLDACRDNPFQPPSPVKYRSFSNLGLAPVQAPRGTVVAYSTAPGQLAADGKDSNSIYTANLAGVMLEPHLSLEGIFKKVGEQVRKKTLDDQIPWFESSLTDAYFFLPPEGIKMTAGRSPQRPAGGSDALLTVSKRGGALNERASDVLWYRSMTEQAWLELEQEIQQRVRNLKEDDLPMLQHQAGGGSVIAQTTLGVVLRDGFSDVPRTNAHTRTSIDLDASVAWLQRSANAGFPIAQLELAEMYNTGRGVSKNPVEARRLIELAAKASYPRALSSLLLIARDTQVQATQAATAATSADQKATKILDDIKTIRDAVTKELTPVEALAKLGYTSNDSDVCKAATAGNEAALALFVRTGITKPVYAQQLGPGYIGFCLEPILLKIGRPVDLAMIFSYLPPTNKDLNTFFLSQHLDQGDEQLEDINGLLRKVGINAGSKPTIEVRATPLMLAVWGNNLEAVDTLLKLGANPDAGAKLIVMDDPSAHTRKIHTITLSPLAEAQRLKRTSIQTVLQQRSAKAIESSAPYPG